MTAFDTLKTARHLKAAGVPPEQAEAHAEALRRAAVTGHDELATRSDIHVLKTDIGVLKTDVRGLKTDIDVLKTDVRGLKTDIRVLETDIRLLKSDIRGLVTRGEFYRALWIQTAGIIGLIVAVDKLL